MINPQINIQQATIAKNTGWLALWPEKRRGVLCWFSKGVFDREDGTKIPWEKVRFADVRVAKDKKGKERLEFTGRGKQRYSMMGFYPELLPYVIEIAQKIREEISGRPQESVMDRIFEGRKDGRF